MDIRLDHLGAWLNSWIQEDGRVFGFHNHMVWGSNPYRWNDWTCGHSTWASPIMPGLARLILKQPNADAEAILRAMVDFQTQSFQENGNYKHIGFQVGERLGIGLIHNAITNASLAETAGLVPDVLGDTLLGQIKNAFERNLAWHGRPSSDGGVCNQEYCRIWEKLLYMDAFPDHRPWYDEVPEDLDTMLTSFHVDGIPDDDCEATMRYPANQKLMEPAEYYGLMIQPLILASEFYGDDRFIDHAVRLCRHVARASWQDARGHTRFHRLYFRPRDEWVHVKEPMLISGMGDTLEGIYEVLKLRPDAEVQEFYDGCMQTFAAYQHPAGFFIPATGWQSEIDIAPSSAWHAHDFRFLANALDTDETFWDGFFKTNEKTAVLLGEQVMWVERGAHWAIADYDMADVYCLRGRKDRDRFGRDLSWVGGDDELAPEFTFDNLPTFAMGEEKIYLLDDGGNDLEVGGIGLPPFDGVENVFS